MDETKSSTVNVYGYDHSGDLAAVVDYCPLVYRGVQVVNTRDIGAMIIRRVGPVPPPLRPPRPPIGRWTPGAAYLLCVIDACRAADGRAVYIDADQADWWALHDHLIARNDLPAEQPAPTRRTDRDRDLAVARLEAMRELARYADRGEDYPVAPDTRAAMSAAWSAAVTARLAERAEEARVRENENSPCQGTLWCDWEEP